MKGRKSGSAGKGRASEARESVFAKDREARGSVFAKDREARESVFAKKGGESAREKYQRLAQQVMEAGDHVDRALAQWSREMPDVEIKGADVLNRARRLTLETRRDIEANFRRHGLDSGEFDVLATLRRAGEPYALRPTELYQSLMISSGGLTARLDRLEAAGLIRRRADDDDARSVRVELTPAGRRKIEAAFRADMELENKMVSGLAESERAELVRLLRKLTQAMKG
jgi:DNA-binding MarR family transcriptional regulator